MWLAIETSKTTPVNTAFGHGGKELKLFVKLSYGRHTMSVQAGQDPKDEIYVLESVARVQYGPHICGEGSRKNGILTVAQARAVNTETASTGLT